MNLLETLTRAADEEQLKLQPLPEHAAAKQDEHMRQHYALLLAAVLTSQDTITEAQTRLLRLLLDSLKLGDIRAQLFEQARALEPAPLTEAARLIREAGFAEHLLVDMLVLLRLDAPLTDEAARLAGELAAFMGLTETDLNTRAQDAREILGLDVTPTTDNATEQKNNKATKAKEQAEEEESDDDLPPPLVIPTMAELWPAYLRQPLTSEALEAGLEGGAWVLEEDLAVHFSWQANDAALFFRNNAVLNTIPDEGEVKLTNCRLVDVALSFTGTCSVSLERCDWSGDYDPELKRTTLITNGQDLTVTDCQFFTRNARAIAVENNSLNITESRFTYCGHSGLHGGAVFHSDHTRQIENCYFNQCLAGYGGALYANTLYGINKCEFIACESWALQDKNVGPIAIYANRNDGSPVLTNCVFRHTSVNVGDSYLGNSRRVIALDCQFISGSLFHYKNDRNTFASNCTFHNGNIYEKEL